MPAFAQHTTEEHRPGLRLLTHADTHENTQRLRHVDFDIKITVFEVKNPQHPYDLDVKNSYVKKSGFKETVPLS